MTKADAENIYNEIIRGYDLAEGVIGVVSQESYSQSTDLVNQVIAFIKQMQDSTEVLGGTFLDFYENEQSADIAMKKDFDGAVRVFFHQARQLLNYIEEQN